VDLQIKEKNVKRGVCKQKPQTKKKGILPIKTTLQCGLKEGEFEWGEGRGEGKKLFKYT